METPNAFKRRKSSLEKHGVDVGVQVRFEERRQKRGKRFSGEQNGAAAARGVRFENGGGFALNGSVVGDFGGVDVY